MAGEILGTTHERFAIAETHEDRRAFLVVSREIISDAHRVIEEFRTNIRQQK